MQVRGQYYQTRTYLKVKRWVARIEMYDASEIVH